MKFCLSGLITLLVCLLVPFSEANGGRNARQEPEKKKGALDSYLTPWNVKMTCALCAGLWKETTYDNCHNDANNGRNDCKAFMTGNRKEFLRAWKNRGGPCLSTYFGGEYETDESASDYSKCISSGGITDDAYRALWETSTGKDPLDEYLANAEKFCRLCRDLIGINDGDCAKYNSHDRYRCRMAARKMPEKFAAKWGGTEDQAREDEASGVRKRKSSMKFTDYFSKAHLAKSCEVCHKLYGINKDDCSKAKKDEKLHCFKKAKDDRSNFMSKWEEHAPAAESASDSRPSKVENSGELAEYFTSQTTEKTCKSCSKKYGLDFESCKNDQNMVRHFCKMLIRNNLADFGAPRKRNAGSSGGSSGGSSSGTSHQSEAFKPAEAAEVPVTPEDFFKPEHVQKTCKVCKIVAKVNYDKCLKSDENHDNKSCRHAIKAIKDKFDEEWKRNPLIRQAFEKQKFGV